VGAVGATHPSVLDGGWALHGRAHPKATQKIKNRKKRKLINFSL
jgi:hypothetical protein